MSKAFFVPEKFKFLSWNFGYVETPLHKKAITSQTGQQIIPIHILSNVSRSKRNQTREHKVRNKFFEKLYSKCKEETSLRPSPKNQNCEHISGSTVWIITKFVLIVYASLGLPKYIQTKMLSFDVI